MISYETRTGTICFTENFLSKLIGHAVTSCFGVVGMMPHTNRQRLFGLVSKEQAMDTGIKVTGNANQINVEIHIMVTYGMNIAAIAESITEKVKYIVEGSTGITVNKVTVKVDGIKE
ncbi:MAG: Asp23/Gls24 family envelope stress response protein [Clostridia bacterium]|nr:Asp23/Gls24 family envelope stress response protein [Clostridia bacterium]